MKFFGSHRKPIQSYERIHQIANDGIICLYDFSGLFSQQSSCFSVESLACLNMTGGREA